MAGEASARSRARIAPTIRSVSSVAFGIGGADAFERAVRASVAWMRARNPSVPGDALRGVPFDIGGGGTPVARAVALEIEDGRIWSGSLDDPDRAVFERTWITEITIAERAGEAHLGTRLLNATGRVDEPFTPSVPRLVRDVIRDLPCHADGEILRDDERVIASGQEVDQLCALLERPSRRLPVIVLAEGVTRQPFSSLEKLTGRLAGAAHVVGLSDACTPLLRRRVGNDLAVFNGAVRMYRPGFRADDADPFDHPLWVLARDRPPGEGAPVVARVLASGVSKGTTDYPRFEAVRQGAAARDIAARRADSSDQEMATLYEAENEALRAQLDALRTEQNQWLADAEAERTAAERRIAELRVESRGHQARADALRAALREGSQPQERAPLSDFADFGAWADANLSPNVWISPKARRAAEREGAYRRPEEVGEALALLDDLYVPLRRQPDQRLNEAWESRLKEAGLALAPCFTRPGDLQRFPEYSVVHRGERRWCDLHLKRGGGTDPRSMFRIYVGWVEEEGVLVVGHLPSHLDNNLTN